MALFRKKDSSLRRLPLLVTAILMSVGANTATARDVIATGPGGSVVEYARQASTARIQNANVRFTGQCASACTLYLSVPTRQTCIMPGASFVFHSARGSNRDFNRWGTAYLMRSYPVWVQNWVRANGGLTNRNLRMSYAYAARYIPTCGTQQRFAPRT